MSCIRASGWSSHPSGLSHLQLNKLVRTSSSRRLNHFKNQPRLHPSYELLPSTHLDTEVTHLEERCRFCDPLNVKREIYSTITLMEFKLGHSNIKCFTLTNKNRIIGLPRPAGDQLETSWRSAGDQLEISHQDLRMLLTRRSSKGVDSRTEGAASDGLEQVWTWC